MSPTPSAEQPAIRRALIVILFLAFCGDYIRGLTAFAAPLVAADLGGSDREIGLVAGAYGILYCFVPIFIGKLSDRIGRRQSLLIAFSLYCCVAFLFMFANSIPLLVLAGILEGICSGFLWPAIGSLVVEISPPDQKKRNIDWYMSSWNLGTIVGPLMAGILYEAGGAKATFLTVAIVCIGAIIGLVGVLRVDRILQTGNHANADDSELLDLPDRLKRNYFLFAFGMILLSAIFLAVLSSYYVGYAYKYTTLTPVLIGLIVFCLPIGRAISFAMMKWVSTSQKLTYSIPLTMIVILCIWGISESTHMLLLCFLFLGTGFVSGFGFSGGFSLITGLDAKNRGLYTGIAEALVGISFFAGPYLPFILLGPSEHNPFLFVILVLLAIIVWFSVLLLMIRKNL
jgi:MFS family permease